jgi:hypothetical protein
MENNKYFFDNLDRNIKLSKNEQSLNFLTKTAKKYVKNLPENIQNKVRLDAKRRLFKSLKLIKKQEKSLKTC